jgi:poly-gamma-glutamate synthase PgsB/CapB
MLPVLLPIAVAATSALIGRWVGQTHAHARRVDALQYRIHVNGIRGKSTVTRIVAGLLREAGVVTVAKSTGTAAAVINRHGEDEPIHRKGAPTILEQIDVVRRYVTRGVDALVIECMALKPAYQDVSERRIVRSNIGILTNVREDHQDVMGETLPEIARSLLSTCPRDGVLVTAEQDPEIVAIICEEAAKRNSRVVVADPGWVSDDDIARFDYIAFKENVAIGLAVAELAGIDRETAMRGMVRADPDPGVLRMKQLVIGDKQVTWANLFAVNDRESMMVAMERIAGFDTPETTKVGILNNRADRERRAMQFADVAVRDLAFDRLATFGAYERMVSDRLIANGYPAAHILNLGEERNPTMAQIVDEMILAMPTSHVLVVGFVNIHTHQAELLLHYFEEVAAAAPGGAIPAGADATAAPACAEPVPALVGRVDGLAELHLDADDLLLTVGLVG